MDSAPPGKPLIEYVIDARNRRIAKKSGGTLIKRWVYQDSLRPAAEIDANGTVTQFVYVGRSNVPAYIVRQGTSYRLIEFR